MDRTIRPGRRALFAGAAALTILLASCSTGGSSEDARPGPAVSPQLPANSDPALASYYTQQLDWQPCGDDAECADLTVPRNYQDPKSDGDFTIKVNRIAGGGEDKLGSLVVNPGGPGGGGLTMATQVAESAREDVSNAYDIVGFDPRGVGTSDPVRCRTDAQLDEFLQVDLTPDDPAETKAFIKAMGAVGEGCATMSPDIYKWMDTVSVARDLDILRNLLDDEKLTFYGASYGTLLGVTYAELFPDTAGRMVLDGATPPDLTMDEILLGQAKGLEMGLERYVENCLAGDECPLTADTVKDGVKQIRDLLEGLDKKPLPGLEGRELTQSIATNSVLNSLYSPPLDWVLLTEGLRSAFAGEGDILVNLYERRLTRDRDGRYETNLMDANRAVNCLERKSWQVGETAGRAADWAEEAPVFGAQMASFGADCAQWPVPAVGKARQISAEGAGPFLIVSTQYDPATPYQDAVRLDKMLADSALVSYNGDGHTGYRKGSNCVDDTVNDFLVTGELPAEDPRCDY